MQPSEQNQNQQQPAQPAPNPAQPLPYAVPEYLHLDPVTGQAKRSPKFPFKILGALVGVILLGLAIFGTVVWVKGAPERQFYSMLDNMLSTSYIVRKLSAVSGSTSFTATIEDDHTKLASNVDYEASQSNSASTTRATNFKGNIIVTSKDYFFGMLDQAPDKLPTKTMLGQWYKVAEPKDTTTGKAATTLDPYGMHTVFNSIHDVVITGKFDPSIRSKALDFMKQNNIYTIQDHQSDTLNGAKVTLYTVNVKNSKRATLNQQLAQTAQITDSGYNPIDGKYIFWVSDSSKRLLKITYTKESVSVTETFDFPSSLDIKQPANFTVIN